MRTLLLLAALLAACSTSTPAAPTAAAIRNDLQAYRDGDFYAVPWPSALRMRDGRVDLARLPARETNYILSTFLPVLEPRLTGFSPNGAVYFYLDATLDTSKLPAKPEASLAAAGPVQLVNVEPQSTRFGERIPVEVAFKPFAGTFQPAHTLAVLPVPGFPMAPGERYAALVRTDAGIGADATTAQLLARPDALPAAEFEVLARALPALGLEAGDIAAATVFRTSEPGRNIRLARERLLTELDAPVPTDLELDPYGAICPAGYFDATPYRLLQGKLELPGFLKGPRPYGRFGSGVFVPDESGVPTLQDSEVAPFSLSLPAVTAPAGGFPVVIYQHGAGGNRHSFVRDGTACSLAKRGLAVIAIDFPVHGERNPQPGSDAVFLLVNPENVPGALDIENQAAVDLYSVARAVPNLVIPGALAPGAKLRAAGLGYIGHSQGSFVGVPFLAYDDTVEAAILSGSGAHMITFITDRIAGQSIDMKLIFGVEGQSLQEAVAVLLGIPGETPDRFHFLFTLIQTIADPVDPVNYAPLVFRETAHPKHVYQSAGFLDEYDPPGVNETLATALGVDIVAPLALAYPKLALRGGKVLEAPVSGNRTANGKKITAVNSQFPQGDHWVYLQDEVARTQGTEFLRTALTGTATVPPR